MFPAQIWKALRHGIPGLYRRVSAHAIPRVCLDPIPSWAFAPARKHPFPRGTRRGWAADLRGAVAMTAATLSLAAAPAGTEAGSGSSASPAPDHWAFRPVQRPTPPVDPASADASPHPIDAFVREKLRESGLAPSGEADRRTWVRRLYLVLLGVPPTPSEVEAFVRDTRPGAFEQWVDRVLADPRYGERWGRHWLDVIRFAESNGFETNRERLNAWRFRDYVIAAFNDDKPYDRFVREQIAGDALGADVATGFLVGGPFDIVKSPDVVLTSQQRADELDDMVSTTGTAFLGLTLGCVRCHAHKFDPIPQNEYYSLAAMFAGVQHADRPLPQSDSQRRRVQSLDQEIARREALLEPYRDEPSVAGTRRRPAVQPRENVETFPRTEARRVRFTIRASAGEPCIDELEVWSGDRNVALATNGTVATASGTLAGYDIHRLEHINDGRVGNGRSWISNEAGRGWVQLEFARPEWIDRVVWGRDREGKFADRLATDYVIESAGATGEWKVLSSSADREPPSVAGTPKGPVYRFEGRAEGEVREARRWLAELEVLRKEREEAGATPAVWAGKFSQPGPTHRLHRGDPMQKREAVAPGTLGIFRPLTLATHAPEQERRLAVADWIIDPRNPLTARVMVNRIWQHHFGVGLVATPNDFGRSGARPSHPELLDWLADEFMHPTGARPWSIKHVQRLIVTSATWRQSGIPRPEAAAVDANNRLLWRFLPRRIEAEAIRDTILAVSGNLDMTVGGPSFYLHKVDRENVYHYHPKEEFTPAEARRMVYAFKVRMEQDGIFGAFDCPDGSLVMPRRSVSTTPLQALNLFNSRFMLGQAGVFAARLEREAGNDPAAQVRRAWAVAFQRPPSDGEWREAVDLVSEAGLGAVCRALLNANELIFIP